MIQTRLAWLLSKDDMQIHETSHILLKKKKKELPAYVDLVEKENKKACKVRMTKLSTFHNRKYGGAFSTQGG